MLFLKQVRVGAEWTSLGKSFKTVGASKTKLWPKCFWIYVHMDRIEEPPRIFYLDGCILYYIFHNENQSRQKRTKVSMMTTVKKLRVEVLKIQGNSTGSQWSRLRKGDAHVYWLPFVTILASVF